MNSAIKVARKNKFYDSRNNCNAIIETATDRIVAGTGYSKIPKSVKSIGCYAFCESAIKNLVIPKSVMQIENNAFENTLIEKLFIPANIRYIGVGAFSYCSTLRSISVDLKNQVYDSRNGCNAIIMSATNTLVAGCVNTIVPNDVTTIGDCAFQGNSAPAELRLPDNVRRIGRAAFRRCAGLEKVFLPKCVDYMGSYAFEECNSLVYVSIQDIRSGAVGCFAGNSALTDVEFHSGLSSVGRKSFSRCLNLESVSLPEGLDSICSDAFMYCPKLKSVKLPASLKYIGSGAFSYCTLQGGLALPQGLESLDLSAFSHCGGITELAVPERTEISGSAHFMENLQVLKLPSKEALRDLKMPLCHNLKEIVIK